MRKFSLLLVAVLALCGSARSQNHSGARVNSWVDVSVCQYKPAPFWCSGSDIGAWINAAAALLGDSGTIFIQDGNYIQTTPISISQTQNKTLTLMCGSRAAVLNYTGRGEAVYITSGSVPTPASNSQVSIENCTFNGSGAAAGTDGIHLFDAQNTHLTNVYVFGFSAANVHGVGAAASLLVGDDFASAGQWNLVWEPDTLNRFGSTTNRMFGGSLVYAGSGNYWDKGRFTPYGSNTSDILDGVTMEEGAGCNVAQQFIVEGTWDAAIRDSYIEYLPCPSGSTKNVFSGVVGNVAGSGIGSNATLPSSNFVFENNYLITPKAGSGFTTATLFVQNGENIKIDRVTDNGPASYGIVFNNLGDLHGITTDSLAIGYQQDLYQQAPTDGHLWFPYTATMYAPGQYQPYSGGTREWLGGLTVSGGANAGYTMYTQRQDVPVTGSPLCSATPNGLCTFVVTLTYAMPDANWHINCQATTETGPGVIYISYADNTTQATVGFKDFSGAANDLTGATCEAWE
jgi:hypothetical protein